MKERLLCAFGLIATITANAAEEIQQLETIEVIGNYSNAVGTSDAASQGVVTPKMFENRPVYRPGEVLETIPGLVITQHSGDGKANQYFLRGYNLDHGTDFATFVAGMPINMRTHAHGQGWTDLNFLIPELISRVDYHKGTYFAEDGDFASAGSARISYAEGSKETSGSMTLGSFGYRRGLVVGGPTLGSGRLIYGLELVRNDGPWERPNEFRKYNGVLRYAQGDRSNGFNVTAMAYDGNWFATDQIAQRAVDSGLIGRFGSLDTTDGGIASRYSLSTEWRSTNDKGITAANLYVARHRLDLFSNFTYFLDSPTSGDQFEQTEKRTLLGGEASQTWFNKVGGRDMSNQVGVQLRHDNLDPVALYSTVARRRVDKLDADGNIIPAVTREDKIKESSIGLYYQNNFQWTEWFRTIAGVRADYYKFKVNSNRPENSGNKSDTLMSPKLSLIFGPWAKTEYFLNVGRGFHSNDARGTTITVDPKTGSTTDAGGNPVQKVDPLVRTVGAEIGVRTEIVPHVETSVALWRLRQDSELLFVGDAGVTEASRPSLRTGIELDLHYTPKPWLLFDFNVAATRARFDDGDPDGIGKRVPGAIERIMTTSVTIDDINGWFGNVQYRYFGPRPLIEDNSVRSASTILTNARVGYKFSKKWNLHFDVFNLFNRKGNDIDYFYRSRLAGEPSGGVDGIHFHPVDKRSSRLSLRGTF